MMTGRMAACVAAGLLAATGAVRAGPKWDVGEDAWMQLSFLGQVHYTHEEDAVQKDDFFLRRGRFILAGQVLDGVKFFVETDNDNAGKRGSDVSTDIQDAFVDVRLFSSDSFEHWLEAGLILLPFSFENRSSAGSLLGNDYNVSTIKFVNTFVWRDYGAMMHGRAGDRVSYCAGVFDGYDVAGGDKNPDAGLRVTGHAAVNLIGRAESGWFYNQCRLPKESYLSIGVGADAQSEATLKVTPAAAGKAETSVVRDSENFVFDVQSAFVLADGLSLTANGGYFLWDNAAFDGDTVFVESGVLMDRTMATLKYETQNPDKGSDVRDYTAGVHYFLKGHNARAGVEYRWGDSNDQVLVGLQFLL